MKRKPNFFGSMRRPVLPGVQRLVDVKRRQHFLVSGLGDLMGQLLSKNVVANAEQIRGPFDLGIASDLHSVVVVFILRKNSRSLRGTAHRTGCSWPVAVTCFRLK